MTVKAISTQKLVLVTTAFVGINCGGGSIEGRFDREARWEEFLMTTYQEPDSEIYIVDGDVPIEDIKQLREFFITYVEGDPLIVHRSGGADARWADSRKRNITYCVSRTSFGSRYDLVVAAMAASTGAWEAVADVDFIHLSNQDNNCTRTNNNVIFDVRQTSGQAYLARAFFPNNSRSSRNILIDSSSFGNLDPWTLNGILRHELGHTLGFRHEHTRPESGTCFEDTSWRSLTPYDSDSVMHYPQCNGSNDGDLVITSLDAQGAANLYGAPNGQPPPPPPPTVTENFSGSLLRDQIVRPGPFTARPGTTFEARMTGSGDADLYVRFGTAPTFSSFNCRPYLSTSNESCVLTVPAGVTQVHVMVHGFSSSSTYNLAVTYSP